MDYNMTVIKVDETIPVLQVKFNVKLAYTERRNILELFFYEKTDVSPLFMSKA